MTTEKSLGTQCLDISNTSNTNVRTSTATELVAYCEDPIFVPTDKGLITFSRMQYVMFWVFPLLFVVTKVADFVMNSWSARPIQAGELWGWVVAGIYRKLDDVSLWTALVGLCCIALIGTAILNLLAADKLVVNSIAPKRRHIVACDRPVSIGDNH